MSPDGSMAEGLILEVGDQGGEVGLGQEVGGLSLVPPQLVKFKWGGDAMANQIGVKEHLPLSGVDLTVDRGIVQPEGKHGGVRLSGLLVVGDKQGPLTALRVTPEGRKDAQTVLGTLPPGGEIG